jgi:hypothetical protein
VWPTPPRAVMAPQINPRTQGWPRPVRLPSSESASANPMLMPAPTEAAIPTRKASQGLRSRIECLRTVLLFGSSSLSLKQKDFSGSFLHFGAGHHANIFGTSDFGFSARSITSARYIRRSIAVSALKKRSEAVLTVIPLLVDDPPTSDVVHEVLLASSPSTSKSSGQ